MSYLRKLGLIFTGSDGAQLNFADFRVQFQVRQIVIGTPGTLYAKIINLSDTTAQQVQKEFSHVTLEAGYEDANYGTLFTGDVRYFRRGRDSQVDTYLDLLAANSDLGYNYATINKSLSAASQDDVISACAASFKTHGVNTGYLQSVGTNKLPRGVTLHGMTRDVLGTAGANAGAEMCFDSSGALTLARSDSYLPGAPVELNSRSGMLGQPQQTPDGIHVSMQLNPNIKIGSLLKIDNTSIQQQLQSTAYLYTGYGFLPKIVADGIYRVLVIQHHGDTRGEDWQTDVICVGATEAIPPALVGKVI